MDEAIIPEAREQCQTALFFARTDGILIGNPPETNMYTDREAEIGR